MTKKTSIPKSLVEQILDQMFATIERKGEFDADLIEKLRQVALSGDLTNVKQVVKAISLRSGEAS